MKTIRAGSGSKDARAHRAAPMTKFKARRLELNLRQCDVSRALGVPEARYNCIENGRRPANRDEEMRLAEILKLEETA